jgi:SAM-dependent methyltransferase
VASTSEYVRAALPEPPARVLEVGAGRGELAAELASAGYDVLAIDPVGEPPVVALALLDLDEPVASFDAAVAVVSLHHVEPLEESLAVLAAAVRPGGTLVVDEFDGVSFDERAARWWAERRRDLGRDAPEDPAAAAADLREHIHPVEKVYEALGEWFVLGPMSRGPYLHRWELDLGMREEEERLIAACELPATGVRFTGRRLGRY